MNIEAPFVVGVEVISVNQSHQSSVHGAGGGGFTYKGTGFTVPVNVHTTHEIRLEVWVKLPDGLEDRLDFTGLDLLVREGHKLALLMGESRIWAVRNFSTGVTTAFIRALDLVEPRKQLGWRVPLLLLLLIPITYWASIFIGGMALALCGASEGLLDDWVYASAGIALITSMACIFCLDSKMRKKWESKVAKCQKIISEGFAMLESAEISPSHNRGSRVKIRH